MQHVNMRIMMLIWALLAAACSAVGANDAERTAVAENESLKTRVAIINATATHEIDRVAITLEHAQTEVRNVVNQNQFLVATLLLRGTPTEGIIVTAANVVNLPATATPAPPSRIVDPNATGEVNAVVSPVSAPTPAGLPTVGAQPILSQIVTATGVGDDDCAVNQTSQFTSDTAEIYVVAVADNIVPGTQIASRWFRENVEVAAFDFVPDFRIDDACIWFFIDQTDAEFTPGEWSVQLSINGGNVGAPMLFTIVDGG
ncbi:MAG: hypothetical protein D6737_05250 [Chloroflexi bacterium]|nr:MAG: hypothetical protein CUN54_02075 [Phototrophicales bacterium]RMF81394.1 MAG: hypothetical protein D6737_05250 [Chloroflexota bacterium]